LSDIGILGNYSDRIDCLASGHGIKDVTKHRQRKSSPEFSQTGLKALFGIFERFNRNQCPVFRLFMS
jgi:hypothetical protein